ncbi:MAG: MarR family winged helix-turn-helix transcriptional regulator [Candidatus Limnocylindrales bacterium]
MRDTKSPAPSLDDVAHRICSAFEPRLGTSVWPVQDITLGQLKTLFMIRAQGPRSIGRIAEAFGIGAAAASGYVERIERHGLVERRHRTDDRRIVECHLTETGQSMLDTLAGMRVDAVRRALDVLSADELRDFDRLLSAIAARRTDAAA